MNFGEGFEGQSFELEVDKMKELSGFIGVRFTNDRRECSILLMNDDGALPTLWMMNCVCNSGIGRVIKAFQLQTSEVLDAVFKTGLTDPSC